METVEHAIDKSEFGPGPWMDEPDKLQWTDEETGLPCLIVRNRMGALCGYVAVSEGHPDYRKPYDDVPVDVHGGLSYADECQGSICHVPEPGKPDNVWWLGFDCAHGGDLTPSSRDLGFSFDGDQYRDLAYVQSECRQLAAQLAARR